MAGDTSGPVMPWETVRIIGTATLDVVARGCGGAAGANARTAVDRIAITVFGPNRNPVAIPTCPPGERTFRLELPEPIGDRPIVDAVAVEGPAPVTWERVSVSGRDITLRVPDPSCTRVGRVTTVEGAASVSFTAFVVDAGTPGCSAGMAPRRDYTVTLAAPVGRRTLVDGRSAYLQSARSTSTTGH
jgi:hypothetical protein